MTNAEYEARKEAARVNLAFYRAFEALDLAAMGEVWADDDSIQCVHPGWERLQGRESVLLSWAAIFTNTREIGFDVNDVTLQAGDGFAWVTCVENIRTEAEGGTWRSEAIATNLFARRNGRYRMVLHHASPVTNRGFDALSD